jgi:hypothetical protein
MSYFYEIRSTSDTVLKRDGGFPDRETATAAAREDARRLKNAPASERVSVGKILVGQSVEQVARY